MKAWELCELRPTTTWYAEHDGPFRFVILDCDSWTCHSRARPSRRARTDAERPTCNMRWRASPMQIPGGVFDYHRRQIPYTTIFPTAVPGVAAALRVGGSARHCHAASAVFRRVIRTPVRSVRRPLAHRGRSGA